MMAKKTELIFVPAERLSVVWAQSQRPYNEAWAKKIAAEFDTDKFDPPVITKPNGVGYYHVVEGQHRVKGAEMAFGPKEQIGCRLVDAEDPARAAEIWLGINAGRKAIRPVQNFIVAVTANRKPQTEINTMVNKMNYKISQAKGDHCICAVTTLIDIHNRFGKDLLLAVLVALDLTWPGDAAAFGGDLMKGYAAFINEFRSLIPKRLAESIHKKFSPGELLIAGRSFKDRRRITLSEGIFEALLQNYNKGLPEDKKLKRK